MSIISNYYNFDKDAPLVSFLKSKGVNFDLGGHESYHLTSKGFMDLTVEIWQEGKFKMLSICHYFVQNGDMMQDPEILYKIHKQDNGTMHEDPQWIQQAPTGRFDEVYSSRGCNVKLKAELLQFTKMWIKNLEFQGHQLAQEVKN